MKLSALLFAALPVSLAGLALPANAFQETQSVDELLAEGRAKLDARQPEAALPLLEQAAELDGSTLRTRMWVLRAWMDLGRPNETADAIDELRRSGVEGAEIDYLYGMAAVRNAQGKLASGVADDSVTMNFQEAIARLAPLLEEDAESFPDAYEPLAQSAWYIQELIVGRWAAEEAVKHFPEDARSWLTLGRVAMSEFITEKEGDAPEAWGEKANAAWERAREAFGKALELGGGDRQLVSEAATELGNSLIWKSAREEAAAAYEKAIAAAPDSANYGQILGLLTPQEAPEGTEPGALFNQTMEAAAKSVGTGNANFTWWLGYSHLNAKRFEEAEKAFLSAFEANPDYVSSWFYVAQARYDNENVAGAAEAMLTGWEKDPNAIVGSMKDNAYYVGRTEAMIGPVFETGDWMKCAHLAEMCAQSMPQVARHWNNMGLFLRDEGDRLRANPEQAPNPKVLKDLWERSYEAYSRALELTPEDPQLLNDTAVMLHYYLQRDLDKALDMYERAIPLAEALLANEELSEDDRPRYEVALRDSKNNHALLLEFIEAQKTDPTAEPRRAG